MYAITEEQRLNLKHTMAMLNSMVKCGDKHSKESLQRFSESLDLINNLNTLYPNEYVVLSKNNYLHKDGSIKQAEIMKDSLGNEIFMVKKDNLYYR